MNKIYFYTTFLLFSVLGTYAQECTPVSYLSEDFDSTPVNTLPSCWSKIVRGDMIISADVYVSGYIGGEQGSLVAAIYDGGAAVSEANDFILVTPAITNLGDGTMRVRFNATKTGTEQAVNVEVGTLNGNGPDAIFTPLESIALTSTLEPQMVALEDISTNTYIGFRLNSSTTGASVVLDHIVVESVPSCGDVANITLPLVTDQGATISWNAGSEETQWEVVYGESTVTDPGTLLSTMITANETTASIIGLATNMPYKVWVRSICDGGNGAWIGPVKFRTECVGVNILTENFDSSGNLPECWNKILRGPNASGDISVATQAFNAHSGSNSVVLSDFFSDLTTSDIILVLPKLSNLNPYSGRLRFYAKGQAVFQIGTLSDNTSTAIFTEVGMVETTSEYTQYVINLDEAVEIGENSYLGIRLSENTSFSPFFYFDDIIWEPIPACPDVMDIGATEITSDTATVTWTPGNSETEWDVTYALSSLTDPATLEPTHIITNPTSHLENLESDTAYNVWVRSVCGEGTGIWVGPISFRTSCLPANVPYTEDFESAVTPGLPFCSTVTNQGVTAWMVDTPYPANNGGFDDTKVLVANDYSNSVNTWFFTRPVNLTAGTNYTLTYKYGTSNSEGYTEKLKVMYGPNDLSDDMIVELADHSSITGAAYETPVTNSVTFTPETTGAYYFGFNAYQDTSQAALYVDDITVDAALSNDDFTTDGFSYYPNPVKNVLNLSYKQNITKVTVCNLLGQEVLTKNINANEAQIDLSPLANGAYMVKINTGNVNKTVKVIKN